VFAFEQPLKPANLRLGCADLGRDELVQLLLHLQLPWTGTLISLRTAPDQWSELSKERQPSRFGLVGGFPSTILRSDERTMLLQVLLDPVQPWLRESYRFTVRIERTVAIFFEVWAEQGSRSKHCHFHECTYRTPIRLVLFGQGLHRVVGLVGSSKEDVELLREFSVEVWGTPYVFVLSAEAPDRDPSGVDRRSGIGERGSDCFAIPDVESRGHTAITIH